MKARLFFLGSGSKGNCTYLETPDARVLIDVGFSDSVLRRRLSLIGRTPEMITHVLVTHEHIDHICGINSFKHAPIYCSPDTGDEILKRANSQMKYKCVPPNKCFEIGKYLRIQAFNINHDAVEPYGYFIETPKGNIGYLTDLGGISNENIKLLSGSSVLIIESNYDPLMLEADTTKHQSVKDRVRSPRGHLSNDQAAALVESAFGSELNDLTHIYLAHISTSTNTEEIAFENMREKVHSMGLQQKIRIKALRQDETWLHEL